MSQSEPPTPSERELVERIRAVDVAAPAALHERVQAMVAERGPQRARRAPALRRTAAAFALALVAAAIVVVATSSSHAHAPIVRDASALTLQAATEPAPAESQTHRSELTAAVDGVAFPYWEDTLGWRSTGARSGHIDGRPVMTVYYENWHGQRVGYAIVSGHAPQLSGGEVHWRGGTPYRLVTIGGVPAVVWLRSGRLCVIAGSGVSHATLLRLASWDGARAD